MKPFSWTLNVNDFRVLDQVRWSPKPGVSILAGANGAGKSTILASLRFLATAFKLGLPEAIRLSGGGTGIRRIGVVERTPVRFKLKVSAVSWELLLPIEGEGVHAYHGETLTHDKDVVLRAAMYQANQYIESQSRPRDSRIGLRFLWDQDRPEYLQPVVTFLETVSSYPVWWPDAVRELQTGNEAESTLNYRGTNLWKVLREWRQAPRRFDDRYQWVMESTKKAFPDLLSEIEFDSLGPVVQGRFYPLGIKDAKQSLPMHLAADGLLQGLLHLTAVAGAARGSIVAIDEVENHLHPHAIRSLITSMREWAEEKDLTVLLTTHSPLVMNTFRREPGRIFVLDRKHKISPSRLDELHKVDWLAQGPLGDLYDRLVFAAPKLVGQ